MESNHRPWGYESHELPLLYPAFRCPAITGLCVRIVKHQSAWTKRVVQFTMIINFWSPVFRGDSKTFGLSREQESNLLHCLATLKRYATVFPLHYPEIYYYLPWLDKRFNSSTFSEILFLICSSLKANKANNLMYARSTSIAAWWSWVQMSSSQPSATSSKIVTKLALHCSVTSKARATKLSSVLSLSVMCKSIHSFWAGCFLSTV